jgi:fatty acid desaturase
MMHPLVEEIRAIDRGRPKLRSFGLLLSLILLLIAGYRFWASGLIDAGSQSFLLAAATLSLVAILAQGLFKPLFLIWMAAALVLGHLMTRVILILVFYLVITPTALVMRIFRKDPLKRKPDPSKNTYWIERDRKEPMGERMKRYY